MRLLIRSFLFVFILSSLVIAIFAQSSDATGVPQNPYLADSPWPVYHANSYAQGSTQLRGPEAGDILEIQTVETRAFARFSHE